MSYQKTKKCNADVSSIGGQGILRSMIATFTITIGIVFLNFKVVEDIIALGL